jgi:hypothetical protein
MTPQYLMTKDSASTLEWNFNTIKDVRSAAGNVKSATPSAHTSSRKTTSALSTSHESTTARFDDLVQSPPRELFDEIYQLTFTGPGGEVDVDEHFIISNKPVPQQPLTVTYSTKFRAPSQLLQIDKASRQLFIRNYFGNTTFTHRSSSRRGSQPILY